MADKDLSLDLWGDDKEEVTIYDERLALLTVIVILYFIGVYMKVVPAVW